MTYCLIPSERCVEIKYFNKNFFYLKSTARATQNRLACHACHRFASAGLQHQVNRNQTQTSLILIFFSNLNHKTISYYATTTHTIILNTKFIIWFELRYSLLQHNLPSHTRDRK